MNAGDALAVAAAGLAAGTVNTVVGSGSLITFPTLLAVGLHPVLANVSNTVGLVPGSASGVHSYRRELGGQRRRVAVLAAASLVGGLAGGGLLLALPGRSFEKVVPLLIVVACGLIAAQPHLARRLAGRPRRAHGGPGLWAAVLATGVYGGYFGAAQGVILISLLAVFLDDDLQRLNGVKNVLALVANAVAAVLFLAATQVSWEAAGLVAAGSVVGGQLGGVVGRRLSPVVLRWVVVLVGTAVAGVLFARYW